MRQPHFPGGSPNLTVMTKAIYKAARGLARDFGEIEHLQVSRKGPADFVTNADLRAEKTLREELMLARPKFGLLMEEGGEVAGEDPAYTWIIDPLDGTKNFLHGIPHFAITVALKKDNEIISGATYDPLRDEMFWAEKGTGCFMNDRRLRVSSRRNLLETVIATGTPYAQSGDHKKFSQEMMAMCLSVSGVRTLGSAALDLAYVAAGRVDGHWERDLKPWDVAAGILMIREAGGYVSPIDRKDDLLTGKSILSANQDLHPQLEKVFKEHVS